MELSQEQKLSLFFMSVEKLTYKDAFEKPKQWIENIERRCAEKSLPSDSEFLVRLAQIVSLRWSGMCSEGARDMMFVVSITELWKWHCGREKMEIAG